MPRRPSHAYSSHAYWVGFSAGEVRVAPLNALARVILQARLDLAVADRRALLAHHDRERALGPLRIRNADDGGFAHAGMLEDEVLDVERRDPFAAGLDDVLETIRDLE